MAAQSTDRAALIQRVRKLLALADATRNDSEAQAKAAFKKAQQLIERHGLDLDEIEFENDDQLFALERFKTFEFNLFKAIMFEWEKVLASAVARAAGMKIIYGTHYRGGTRERYVAFVGHENDGPVALAMYPAILKIGRALAKGWAAINYVSGTSKETKDFLLGFALGVRRRAAEDRRAFEKAAKAAAAEAAGPNTNRGLIVVTKARMVEVALKKLHPNLGTERGRAPRYSEAHVAGFAEGKARSLSRGTLKRGGGRSRLES